MEAVELQNLVLSLNSEFKIREKADRAAVLIPRNLLIETMQTLKTDDRFQFDMLMAHTAIDWLSNQQIELVYQLYSSTLGHYLMISVLTERSEAVVPTVSSLWSIAEWQEREVFDLFGIKYSGHPDLRRLLLDDDWKGYPLLKDYKDDFMLVRPW